MQIRTNKKFAVVTLWASLALVLSGCAAGNNAETRMTAQVTDGTDADISTMGNDIKVRSILVVAQPDGSAVLTGSIFNGVATADELLGVAIGGKIATLGDTSYPVAQGRPLTLAGMTKNSSVVVEDLNATFGTSISVQFFFARAGELTLTTLVREKSGEFANVGDEDINAI